MTRTCLRWICLACGGGATRSLVFACCASTLPFLRSCGLRRARDRKRKIRRGRTSLLTRQGKGGFLPGKKFIEDCAHTQFLRAGRATRLGGKCAKKAH